MLIFTASILFGLYINAQEIEKYENNFFSIVTPKSWAITSLEITNGDSFDFYSGDGLILNIKYYEIDKTQSTNNIINKYISDLKTELRTEIIRGSAIISKRNATQLTYKVKDTQTIEDVFIYKNVLYSIKYAKNAEQIMTVINSIILKK